MSTRNPMDGLVGAHGRPVVDPDTGTARCTADSKQRRAAGSPPGSDEARCRRPPVPGATVCRYHGATAPQVARAAHLRLLDMLDPARARVARLIIESKSETTLWRIWRDLEDRVGIPRGMEVTIDDVRASILHALGADETDDPLDDE